MIVFPGYLVRQKNGEICLDQEMGFKVFFFTDSCSLDIVFEDSNWWHFVIIDHFEIFKMGKRRAGKT